MLSIANAVLLAALTSVVLGQTSGCGSAPPASGPKTIGDREYTLQVPDNYDPETPYRLIFGFHGLGGSMDETAAADYFGLRAVADETAIFIAGNGLNAGWANTGGSDVAYIDDILAEVQSQLCVDETQRFATGFSYGGAMSYALACARPDIFRAIAVIGGAQLSGCSGGDTPVAYLGIHGVADEVLPVSSGRQLRDHYLEVNGCQSAEAAEPSPGAEGYIKTEYTCSAGFPVWWVAHGEGHVGEATQDGVNYFATESWNFFTTALGGKVVSGES